MKGEMWFDKNCDDWILKVMECEYGFNISSGEL